MNITINVHQCDDGSAGMVVLGQILLVKQLGAWVVYPALRKLFRTLDSVAKLEALAASVADAERLLAEAEKNLDIQNELPDFLARCKTGLSRIREEVGGLQEVCNQRTRLGHLFRPTSNFAGEIRTQTAELETLVAGIQTSSLRAKRLATRRVRENAAPLSPEEQIADIESIQYPSFPSLPGLPVSLNPFRGWRERVTKLVVRDLETGLGSPDGQASVSDAIGSNVQSSTGIELSTIASTSAELPGTACTYEASIQHTDSLLFEEERALGVEAMNTQELHEEVMEQLRQLEEMCGVSS